MSKPKLVADNPPSVHAVIGGEVYVIVNAIGVDTDRAKKIFQMPAENHPTGGVPLLDWIDLGVHVDGRGPDRQLFPYYRAAVKSEDVQWWVDCFDKMIAMFDAEPKFTYLGGDRIISFSKDGVEHSVTVPEDEVKVLAELCRLDSEMGWVRIKDLLKEQS